MEKKHQVATIGGIAFELPSEDFLCDECNTANKLSDDDLPPFHCNECGAKLQYVRPVSPVNGVINELA